MLTLRNNKAFAPHSINASDVTGLTELVEVLVARLERLEEGRRAAASVLEVPADARPEVCRVEHGDAETLLSRERESQFH